MPRWRGSTLGAVAAAITVARASAAAASPLPHCGGSARAAPRHFAVRLAAMPTLADIFALDRLLAAHGDAPLPHALLTYGLDLVGQRDHLLLAGASDIVVPRRVANARAVERTGGSLDEVAAGVALVCTPSWTVYPVAGIGATRLDLLVARRGAATIDSVLAGAAAGGALSSRTLYDDYGVGVDYRGAAARAGAFSAGARIGYVERFGRARWTLAGEPIAGGPKYGLSGWYVRAGVGLGF